MRTDDLPGLVAALQGWRLDGEVAVYAPGGDWTGQVRVVGAPARATRSWHTVVLAAGVARHTRLCGSPAEALRWAQQLVDAAGA